MLAGRASWTSLIYVFISTAANSLTLKSDLRARRRCKNLEFTVARQAESSVFMGTFHRSGCFGGSDWSTQTAPPILLIPHGAFKCLLPCKSVRQPLSKPRKVFTIGLKINDHSCFADWDQSSNEAASLMLTGGYATVSQRGDTSLSLKGAS